MITDTLIESKAQRIFILDAFHSNTPPMIAKFLWETTEFINKRAYLDFVSIYGDTLDMRNLIIQWQYIKYNASH
tara:strand:+ start:1704 stop:1925 length:222 start_codon:yes stop_codon:yes gene_type:complete